MVSQYEKGFYSGTCITTFTLSSVMVICGVVTLSFMFVPLFVALCLFIIWGYAK